MSQRLIFLCAWQQPTKTIYTQTRKKKQHKRYTDTYDTNKYATDEEKT